MFSQGSFSSSSHSPPFFTSTVQQCSAAPSLQAAATMPLIERTLLPRPFGRDKEVKVLLCLPTYGAAAAATHGGRDFLHLRGEGGAGVPKLFLNFPSERERERTREREEETFRRMVGVTCKFLVGLTQQTLFSSFRPHPLRESWLISFASAESLLLGMRQMQGLMEVHAKLLLFCNANCKKNMWAARKRHFHVNGEKCRTLTTTSVST